MDDVLINLISSMPQTAGLLLLVWFLWRMFQLVWQAWAESRAELRECYEIRKNLEAQLQEVRNGMKR